MENSLSINGLRVSFAESLVSVDPTDTSEPRAGPQIKRQGRKRKTSRRKITVSSQGQYRRCNLAELGDRE
jgi:hypothetical protein